MARKKAEPLHEPVASETQRDTVPTKALPPLSAFDRRSDGERLGACPACGGVRWWDNRAKKRAAQVPADTPDFTCVRCRAPHSEDDPPNPPGTSVTEVPAEPVGRAGRSGSGGQCAKIKADGTRCRGGAMAGSDFCGPHSGATSAPPNRCQGVTKAGTPCAAAPPRESASARPTPRRRRDALVGPAPWLGDADTFRGRSSTEVLARALPSR